MKNKKQWPKCPWCGRTVHHPKITDEPITMFKIMSQEEFKKFEKAGHPPIFTRGYKWYWIRAKPDVIERGWIVRKRVVLWHVEFALVLPYIKQHRWYDNPKSYAQAVRRLKKLAQQSEP